MNLETMNTVNSPMRKILLYGDVNLNIIDGSAIWLLSMAEALSGTNSHVTLLLKSNVNRSGFLDRISNLTNVEIVQPFADPSGQSEPELAPRAAAQRLAQIDKDINSDIVICRGSKVCAHVANSDRLSDKSWLYMTDIPHPVQQISDDRLNQIRSIVRSSKRMFAQTRDAQSYLEAIAPEACGKTLILNPMIPDEYYRFETPASTEDGVSLVYSGKFAKDWRTLEMCDLPLILSAAGMPCSLTMIGDKFQNDPSDKTWSLRMRDSIQNSGIDWLGGMSRDAAALAVSGHDISLSWRTKTMDGSFEISTKVLESAAMGVPPLINRTEAHEEIFGTDYPLFLDNDDSRDVISVITKMGSVPAVLREQVRAAVGEYSISASAARLEAYFRRTEADYSAVPRQKKKTRVLLAGHDFKFAGELVELLSIRDDIELKFDHWASLHNHDLIHSQDMVEWADVIICEWAGPNAVWYSNNKRKRQKLIVRLHMFELRGPWLSNIDVDSIDTLFCVSDLYEQRVRDTEGWESVNIRVIPNAVDSTDLLRPKYKDSQFRLGMVGIVPIRKRLDRAVDLMRGLLEKDNRYTLHVRGRMPWEYSYEWNKPTQQLAYRQIFSEIGADQRLMDSIVFEPFGADMGSWLRKIGFLLSPSSDESFHLAPAEGMASGAIPVFWPRPGVEGIFGNRWKISDTNAAVDFVHSLANDPFEREIEGAAAVEFSGRFETVTVAASWLDEVL